MDDLMVKWTRCCARILFWGLSAALVIGCKSETPEPIGFPPDSQQTEIRKKRSSEPPTWVNVISDGGETLQVDKIAAFGGGCPRFGDPDIDGKYRELCPLRAEKWNSLLEYADSIKQGYLRDSGWGGYFKKNANDRIECKMAVDRPVAIYLIDSVVIIHVVEYFDSIDVRYQNGAASLNFRGYVNPEERGYPGFGGGDGIHSGDMEDEPGTILVMKARQLKRIVMNSPEGMIRGEYFARNRELIPVSKKLLWPCTPVISMW